MLIYILTGLLVSLSLKNYEELNLNRLVTKKLDMLKVLYKNVAVLTLVIIFGIRDFSIGTDTESYRYIFNILGKDIELSSSEYEIGFSFLSIVINKIFNNFSIFLLLLGLIMYWNIISGICQISKVPSISVMCYFCLRLYAQSFNLLRQYLALSFCFIALVYLIKNNSKVGFIVYVLMGFLFHKSAILFLIVLPLKYIKFNYKTIIVSVVCSVLIIIFLPNIIKGFDNITGSNYYKYIKLESSVFSISNISTIIVMICAVLLILLNFKKIKKNTTTSKEYNLFANMFLIFVCVFIISNFSIPLVNRISIYFQPSILFLVPMIICSFKKLELRKIKTICFVIFVVLTIVILKLEGAYDTLPYTTIFN